MTVIIAHAPCMITTLPSWDRRNIIKNNTTFLCFPFSNFRYSLTLFSKFFASFPHGTCSLSVSRQYLALDEIYHPFCTALPSNATLRSRLVEEQHPGHRRDSHPLWCPIPEDLYPACPRVPLSRLQFGVGTTSILNLSSSRFTRRY